MAELPTWPVSLPPPLIDGAGLTPQPNQIRSQNDAGAARVRPRFTAAARNVRYTVVCSEAQVQVLDDFVEITLRDTLPFHWLDFRRPAAGQPPAVYRFKSRPAYAPRNNGRQWAATLDLEMLTADPGRFLLDVSDNTTGLTNT